MIEGLTQTVLSVYDSVGVTVNTGLTLSSDEGFSLTDCRSNRISFIRTKVVMFKPLS